MAIEQDISAESKSRARSFETRFEGRRQQQYRGIPIFAAPGVHEFALEQLSLLVPAGKRVLELGAGGGAMSQRLHDAGYDVCACDLFHENFTPPDAIRFCPADLNADFSTKLDGPWDVIVALELIEHLENPRNFVRECKRLLAPGGLVVMSTPNLGNPVSHALFLRKGDFQWFSEMDYREHGHITPLAPSAARRCFSEQGFVQRFEGSVSNPYRKMRSLRKLGSRIAAHVLTLFLATPKSLRGEVYMGVWQKEAAA